VFVVLKQALTSIRRSYSRPGTFNSALLVTPLLLIRAPMELPNSRHDHVVCDVALSVCAPVGSPPSCEACEGVSVVAEVSGKT